MTKVRQTATCSSCGQQISIKHTGPCPNCGHNGKTFKVEIHDKVNIKGSLSVTAIKEFYKTNRRVKCFVIVISIISPVVGLFFAGIPGIVIGLALSAATYLLSPHAVTKIREIRTTTSS